MEGNVNTGGWRGLHCAGRINRVEPAPRRRLGRQDCLPAYHESLVRDDTARTQGGHHAVASKSLNQGLSAAKKAADEFYT